MVVAEFRDDQVCSTGKWSCDVFCLINKTLVYFYGLGLQGYKEGVNIPIAKPARRLYNVRNLVNHSDSIVVQIDATEGNKVITVRSPLQVKKTNQRNQKAESSASHSEQLCFSSLMLFFFF